MTGMLTPEEEHLLASNPFYETLKSYFIKYLIANKRVMEIKMPYRKPCDNEAIDLWQSSYTCEMPEDLKDFYLSVDGFELIVYFSHGGYRLLYGSLKINRLCQLRKLFPRDSSDNKFSNSFYGEPCFYNENCKIFVLDQCERVGAICLVVMSDFPKATIWLLDCSYRWYFLCTSFTDYFRTMLYYKGLPEWQFLLTAHGISPYAEAVMNAFDSSLYEPLVTINSYDEVNIYKEMFSELEREFINPTGSIGNMEKKKISFVTRTRMGVTKLKNCRVPKKCKNQLQ